MYSSPVSINDVLMSDHTHTIVHEDTMDTTGGLTPPHSHAHLSTSSSKTFLPRLPDSLISDSAVRVSGNLGDMIFNSEDEEDSQQVRTAVVCCVFGH